MIGVFWNLRGISKKGMAAYLADTIKDHAMDFIGLMETLKNNMMTNSSGKLTLMVYFSGNGFLRLGRLVVS